MTRQVTMYAPLARAPDTSTATEAESPAGCFGRVVSRRLPLPSNSCTESADVTTGSLNVSDTCLGASFSTAPPTGSVDCSDAWALAAWGARKTATTAPTTTNSARAASGRGCTRRPAIGVLVVRGDGSVPEDRCRFGAPT